jgi:predicted MPP superfamily phosphohydrolase
MSIPSEDRSPILRETDATGATTDLSSLSARIGRTHLRQRLGLEEDHEVFVVRRPGAHFFYPENWYSVHGVIRTCLRLSGMYGRAQRNACTLQVKHHRVVIPHLPEVFDGYRILHLTDLHVDMEPRNTHAISERVRALEYDLCVLTGDYRARTFGPIDKVLAGMATIRLHLKGPVYGVLGNHDTLHLVPGLEDLGIRLLLNEAVVIERDGQSLHMAGVDDAHYYQAHNIDRAVADIPDDAASILLSHTPEIYRLAAYAGFDLMLSGHTHGGQICLPGGIPIIWDARCPRAIASGPWRYRNLIGYTSVGAGTSVVNARINCLPEITLHELRRT